MISASMIEAGIIAMKENDNQPDAVVVAAVYAAMREISQTLPDLDAAERAKGGGPSNQPRYYVHGKAEDDDNA